MILLISSFLLVVCIGSLIVGVNQNQEGLQSIGGAGIVIILLFGFGMLGLIAPTKSNNILFDDYKYERTENYTVVLVNQNKINQSEFSGKFGIKVSRKSFSYNNIGEEDLYFRLKYGINSYNFQVYERLLICTNRTGEEYCERFKYEDKKD